MALWTRKLRSRRCGTAVAPDAFASRRHSERYVAATASEAIADISAKGPRFPDKPIVESQSTLIRIALCEGVTKVVPISQILHPHTDVQAALRLGPALECQPAVGNRVGALGDAFGVLGVEVLLAVPVTIQQQAQVSRGKPCKAPG